MTGLDQQVALGSGLDARVPDHLDPATNIVQVLLDGAIRMVPVAVRADVQTAEPRPDLAERLMGRADDEVRSASFMFSKASPAR